MTLHRLIACAVLPLTCTPFAAPAAADPDSKAKFSAELSAGLVADSDVGLADLDQTTRQGDIASLAGLKLDAEVKPTGKLTLRGGYELTDTRYQDFSAFNLQTHRLSAEAEYKLGATTTGVLYNYVEASVDGDSYLGFQQVSPYVSHLFGRSLLLRGAYAYTERDFDVETGRDSTGKEVQLDAFFLIDGTRRYLVLGGKGGQTDADDEAFSYDNAALKGRFIQRAGLYGRDLKLRLGADFEARDYSGIAAGLPVPREDQTASANAGMQVQLAGPLSLDLNYEYRQRDSNVAAADFDENVGTVQVKLAF